MPNYDTVDGLIICLGYLVVFLALFMVFAVCEEVARHIVERRQKKADSAIRKSAARRRAIVCRDFARL